MSGVAVASIAASNGIQGAVRNDSARSESGSGQGPNANARNLPTRNKRSKKSVSQKTPTVTAATATTAQVQASSLREEASASRQNRPAKNQRNKRIDKSVTCKICGLRFGDKAALEIHVQNAPEHFSDRKTNMSQGSVVTSTSTTAAIVTNADGDRPSVTASISGSSLQRGRQASAGTKKAVSKAELHCAICNRNFYKENGLRMHVETSKEHKANLQKESSEKRLSQEVTVEAAVDDPVFQKPAFQMSTFDAFAFLERASGSMDTMREVSATAADLRQEIETKLPPLIVVDGIQGGWSAISEDMHARILELMRAKCHPVYCLEKNGYVLRESTPEELEGYWRCENCRGCITLPSHSYVPPEDRILHKFNHYAPAPPSSTPRLKPARPAVVLDCEMVEVDYNTSEVVRLCAVDFLSGSVLIDTYVMPTGKITDYRTRYSGVTPSMLSKMKIVGWAAARAELYKFIDDSTILIGQSLNNDLDVLRVVHFNIIDTAIVTQMAVGPECTRRWGLKALCNAFLDREIQNRKTGHECLEDVFATREVLWWCMRFPEKLAVWADAEREAMRKKKEEEEAKRAADKKRKKEENAKEAVEEDKKQGEIETEG
ncbi:RNA exonuclease, putative [Paecilomyces variotii No. 5]|uniref:RNA exonuclease, putative n=1 Tax=Byssochlamys spectabilis (strain No. 5 / NBRC 109023) TaxID=1356009 RepID=V5G4Q6_BYSSN|nr:RNA exonuclease, putative [Paecilomyces variotii No. 5]